MATKTQLQGFIKARKLAASKEDKAIEKLNGSNDKDVKAVLKLFDSAKNLYDACKSSKGKKTDSALLDSLTSKDDKKKKSKKKSSKKGSSKTKKKDSITVETQSDNAKVGITLVTPDKVSCPKEVDGQPVVPITVKQKDGGNTYGCGKVELK